MNEEHSHPSPIRRILVALDASISSLNALQTAVELAARFDARVLGLYVEDINLLRLAELPFAREVSLYSSRPRRLKPLDMEMQLRTQAARIRAVLGRAAEKHRVPWEFRTTRGEVGAEVLSAGGDADLVVLGKIGRSLPGPRRSGSTARTLLMQRRGMTLIVYSQLRYADAPIVAVYDGTREAPRVLQIAAFLSKSNHTPLTVLILGDDEEGLKKNRGEAEEQVRSLEAPAEFRSLTRFEHAGLAERIRKESTGPVVLPCQGDWFKGEKLCGLVEEIPNPVLLIR